MKSRKVCWLIFSRKHWINTAICYHAPAYYIKNINRSNFMLKSLIKKLITISLMLCITVKLSPMQQHQPFQPPITQPKQTLMLFTCTKHVADQGFLCKNCEGRCGLCKSFFGPYGEMSPGFRVCPDPSCQGIFLNFFLWKDNVKRA